MVIRNSSGVPLYVEDLQQSIAELSSLQREMLSVTIGNLKAEDFHLEQIYPVSIYDLSLLKGVEPSEAYKQLGLATSDLFDKFVMIRGGIEAQFPDEMEFYRWLAQVRHSDQNFTVGLIFSEMVKLYLKDIQKILNSEEEPEEQKELDLF